MDMMAGVKKSMFSKNRLILNCLVLLVSSFFSLSSIGEEQHEVEVLRISEVDFKLVKLTHDEFLDLKYGGEYDVVVNDHGKTIEVVYIPKLIISKPVLGGRNKNGREVRYVICKQSSQIIEKSFSR